MVRFILGELFGTWGWQPNDRMWCWLDVFESCCVGVEGSSKSICVRRFSPSALSFFRFDLSPFPKKRLILRLSETCWWCLANASNHIFLIILFKPSWLDLQTTAFQLRTDFVLVYSGAPARAKRARSGAPWVRKFGKLSIPENLVMT